MCQFLEENESDEDVREEAIMEVEADLIRSELYRSKNFPSFSTFMRARFDSQFKDVKKREKHYHCRCQTCAEQTQVFWPAASAQSVRNTTQYHDSTVIR